jgi:rare lipoprotein A
MRSVVGAKTALKAAFAAGVVATVMAGAGQREAQAEPVVSSWYGPGFEGATTASGVAFDPDGFTAAHPTLPFGTRLLVTYGGEQVVVTVTDRGPFVGGRGLDLSQAAAERIGLTAVGADVVDVQVLGY